MSITSSRPLSSALALFHAVLNSSTHGAISRPSRTSQHWVRLCSCSSTNHKVWAAKFTARHPNLVALEISSFKCGHDAPIYGVMRRHYRAVRDAVFLLQGPRREQALGVDPYSRGND